MGGRGASMKSEVPYDKWGPEKDEDIYDSDGNHIGRVEDRTVFINEPDVRPVTKAEVLKDIDNWRNDDGTYGDEDTAIYLAYKDGTFVDASDLNGKAYKKTGIVGASISTADYEMVWGGEMKNGSLQMWETWSPDGGSGKHNSYSGYKTVGSYRERVETTYNNPNGKGGYTARRRVIRRSTVHRW